MDSTNKTKDPTKKPMGFPRGYPMDIPSLKKYQRNDGIDGPNGICFQSRLFTMVSVIGGVFFWWGRDDFQELLQELLAESSEITAKLDVQILGAFWGRLPSGKLPHTYGKIHHF